MKFPTYKEITISMLSLEFTRDQLKKSGAGEGPTIVYFELPPDEIEEAIEMLQKALRNLKIDPYLPYPLFIYADGLKFHSVFPVLKRADSRPKHFEFPFDGSSMTKKEARPMQKVQILTERIRNIHLAERRLELKSALKQNRQVYQLACETDFYEKILDQYKWNTNGEEKKEKP